MRRRRQVKSFMNDVISFDGPPLDFTNKKVKDLKGESLASRITVCKPQKGEKAEVVLGIK